jgi:hypothetical protein
MKKRVQRKGVGVQAGREKGLGTFLCRNGGQAG